MTWHQLQHIYIGFIRIFQVFSRLGEDIISSILWQGGHKMLQIDWGAKQEQNQELIHPSVDSDTYQNLSIGLLTIMWLIPLVKNFASLDVAIPLKNLASFLYIYVLQDNIEILSFMLCKLFYTFIHLCFAGSSWKCGFGVLCLFWWILLEFIFILI